MFEQAGFILVSIIVLGILVFVHELGHFLFAKLARIGVIEFSIGFGWKVWRKRLGETYYSLRAIPLGGFVRMAGDDPLALEQSKSEPSNEADKKQESNPKAEEEKASNGSTIADWMDDKDKAMLADESRWFLRKSFLPKTMVVLAGPLFNLIFGILLAIGSFYYYGKPVMVDKPVIGEVVPDYPAQKAGVKVGDRIKAIDGVPMETWEQMSKAFRLSQGRELSVDIERTLSSEAKTEELNVKITGMLDTAEMKLLDERSSSEEKVFKVGIMPSTRHVAVGFKEACLHGTVQVYVLSRLTFRLLGALIKGAVEPSKVVGGPISVFSGAAKSAKRGAESLIDFMVLLSVSLAIFNLLPIPILDGGHLAFFIIEKIKGSPVRLKWQLLANQIGMFLLILLMVFAVSNDIIRMF